MNQSSSISNRFWLCIAGVFVIAGVALVFIPRRKSAIVEPSFESAGASRNPVHASGTSKLALKNPFQNYRRLYDNSGDVTLFSRIAPKEDKSGDLWVCDAAGKERLIAENVTGAKFSPDGRKIAYATTSGDVLIETLTGDRLAEISRASDPVWDADSIRLKFMAMADPEYPELQQEAIYQLDSGSIGKKSETPGGD